MSPRQATRSDIPVLARIVTAWEDAQPALPEPPAAEVIAGYIDAAFDAREIWVIGDPPRAYASYDPETAKLGAIYCAAPGRGDGKALLDQVKTGRDHVWLTTHDFNTKAHRFYAREGFAHTATLPGEPPHDTVPLLRMEWQP